MSGDSESGGGGPGFRKPPLPGEPETPDPPEAGNGDASFRERLEWQWICAQARARGVPERDVDDVAQEVVIAMSRIEHRTVGPEGEPPEELTRALLQRLVWQQTSAYRERRDRRPVIELSALPEDMPEVAPVPSAEDLALARTPAALVRAAVALLESFAPEQHAVVTAHDLAEVPMCEVAARLRIRPATAWNRLRLGRSAVRAILLRWARNG